MHTIQISQRTDTAGTLALTIPLGQPDTEFEVVVVVQPTATAPTNPSSTADRWAAVDAFRERLAASGRDFGDSTEDIREDRER